MQIKVGSVIEAADRPKTREMVTKSLEAATVQQTPAWLSVDTKALRGEVLAVPTREQIAPVVDEQAIVELYSR